jgi:hypothetical protein
MLRTLTVCAALLLFIAAMTYLGGYFALSCQHCAPGERTFGAKWQYDLYRPLMDAEQWMRGDGFTFGFQ